jgi:putative PIN family toxin of toxin-antitoxin system
VIAVLDTNVLVSALVAPNGTAGQVVRRWLYGDFGLVISPLMVLELQDVLSRPKFGRIEESAPGAGTELLSAINEHAEVVAHEPVSVISDDPDDDVVLGTALAGGAEFLVTGDKHLLVLDFHQHVQIQTPGEFRSLLDAPDLLP